MRATRGIRGLHTRIRNFISHIPAWKKPRAAVFLHIQKTAGTSIVDTARLFYPSDLVSHADYMSLPFEEINKRRFVSGHFGYSFARPLMADRFSFTFLRNPLERLVSMYYFCRARDPAEYDIYRLARAHTFDEFLHLALRREAGVSDMMYHRLWNHQAWQLAAGWGPLHGDHDDGNRLRADGNSGLDELGAAEIHDLAAAHLCEFDHIGFQEDFENDCRTIFSALKCRNPQSLHHSNATASRPRLVDLPQSTIEKMMKLTEIDREIYNIAWKQRKTMG